MRTVSQKTGRFCTPVLACFWHFSAKNRAFLAATAHTGPKIATFMPK
jgi:hypothetical protein